MCDDLQVHLSGGFFRSATSGPPPAPAMSGDRHSATFSVADEDHTLGNALRFFLNKKCE